MNEDIHDMTCALSEKRPSELFLLERERANESCVGGRGKRSTDLLCVHVFGMGPMDGTHKDAVVLDGDCAIHLSRP